MGTAEATGGRACVGSMAALLSPPPCRLRDRGAHPASAGCARGASAGWRPNRDDNQSVLRSQGGTVLTGVCIYAWGRVYAHTCACS
eukprot:scaffold383_cov317-Prasinococcus_capsulatus_cf.AAC.2